MLCYTKLNSLVFFLGYSKPGCVIVFDLLTMKKNGQREIQKKLFSLESSVSNKNIIFLQKLFLFIHLLLFYADPTFFKFESQATRFEFCNSICLPRKAVGGFRKTVHVDSSDFRTYFLQNSMFSLCHSTVNQKMLGYENWANGTDPLNFFL